jgi:hypothetical protein
MKYPTYVEVLNASHIDLWYWWRFLTPPGMYHISENCVNEVLMIQASIMDFIGERLFKEFGGLPPGD